MADGDGDQKRDSPWVHFMGEDQKEIYVNARLVRSITAVIGGRSLIKFDANHAVTVSEEPAQVIAKLDV